MIHVHSTFSPKIASHLTFIKETWWNRFILCMVCTDCNSSFRSVIYRWLLTFLSVACCSWMPSDYVDPCTPPSPSISLVHAYRDDELVSVPCNLLVQGDVVILGPGHLAPAQVQQVNAGLSRFCLL